jgi:predicted alpha/beta hydrolase family esterase
MQNTRQERSPTRKAALYVIFRIMSNAILVPGCPGKDEHYDPARPSNSEDHWLSWLKRQLILRDVHAVSIEPPFPFKPCYSDWKREFERFDTTTETILVGHSCGGGFLVRYLSEHPDLEVGKVALVAPWMNPFDSPDSDTADFFSFTLDSGFPVRTKGVVVFISTDDDPSVLRTYEMLKQNVHGLQYKEYTDKGHFTLNDLGTREFPELLEVVLPKN